MEHNNLIALIVLIHQICFPTVSKKNIIVHVSGSPDYFDKSVAASSENVWCNVDIDVNSTTGMVPPFWKNTGLCPPDPHQEAHKFLLSRDVHLELALLSALPNNGISHIRIHWLLDLVRMSVHFNGTRTYNYFYLDELVDRMFKYKLGLIFELMGNPSNIFTDFENSTQVFWWKDFVQNLAIHYIDLYGEKSVSSWRFETWNEPDHHDFDGVNFTIQGFLNYYDACSKGLWSASRKLKFGGPGGSCHTTGKDPSPMCWALLYHCAFGKNYFTGERGNRLDFISFHKKGNGTSEQILLDELVTMNYIQAHFPKFSRIPFYNDEADPLKNWSLPKWWRADVTYAAMVAKVIAEHTHTYFSPKYSTSQNFKLGLLSNDNAFLSYYPNQFFQRTLLARFQINNTSPSYVQFVRKPIFSMMGLLSQLCEKLLELKIHLKSTFPKNNFGGIATLCHSEKRFRMSILLYNSADTDNSTGIAHINLFLKNLPNGIEMRYGLFQMNNDITNPFSVWKRMGYPPFPTSLQLSAIKAHEEPVLEQFGSFNTSSNQFNFTIPRPGLALLNICARGKLPARVGNVKIIQISHTSIEITWKDIKNRCVLFYKVQHSHKFRGPFKPLHRKSIFLSYWHSCDEKNFHCHIEGFYRIQAFNYWKEGGKFSYPVKI